MQCISNFDINAIMVTGEGEGGLNNAVWFKNYLFNLCNVM